MEFGIEELLFLMGEPRLSFTSVYKLIFEIRFPSIITEVQSCHERKNCKSV